MVEHIVSISEALNLIPKFNKTKIQCIQTGNLGSNALRLLNLN